MFLRYFSSNAPFSSDRIPHCVSVGLVADLSGTVPVTTSVLTKNPILLSGNRGKTDFVKIMSVASEGAELYKCCDRHSIIGAVLKDT